MRHSSYINNVVAVAFLLLVVVVMLLSLAEVVLYLEPKQSQLIYVPVIVKMCILYKNVLCPKLCHLLLFDVFKFYIV